MKQFEDELKRALARREPSDNFTAEVLAKTAERERNVREARHWRPLALFSAWLGVLLSSRRAAAFALLAILAAGAFYQHQLQQRERGEAAKRQLMTALQIAGTQLHEVQRRVKRIEFPEVVMQ